MTSAGNLGPLGAALQDRKVVLCLGSGGVGKTTTAAVLALGLAREGERVVVLTIDPARRLADALGLAGRLSNEPTLVTARGTGEPDGAHDSAGDDEAGDDEAGDDEAGWADAGEVWATMLDPGETFRRVVAAEASSEEQAERILNNRLFLNLTTTLSGTNEYMAAERLHQLDADERFDRIIVDTPPSRHVLDFLDSPGRLTRFVDHRLYRSVLAPGRGLLRPLNAGAKLMMRLLAGLVGSSLVDDVVNFFADFEGMDEGFRRRATEIDDLLAGPNTAYVLITAPRSDRLAEAGWILDNLGRRGRLLNGLLINRVLPFAPVEGAERASEADGPLAENLRQLQTLAAQEQELIGPLVDRVRSGRGADEVAVVQLPEQLVPVHDLGGLLALVDEFAAGADSG